MRVAITAALLVLGSAAPAGAYLPPAYGGKLVAALAEMPVTFDPASATRGAELQLCTLLYDTLFLYRTRRNQTPHLAASWPQISADGKTWTISIRRGVQLHDGRQLVAADVVASLRRLQGSPANGYLLSAVKRIASGPNNAVVLTLVRRVPELPLLLSAPAAAITRLMPSGRVVGSGPFRLVRKAPRSLSLSANTKHFAGRPYLNKLELKVFDRSSSEAASFQVGALQLSRHGVSVMGGTPKHPPAALDTAAVTTIYLGVGRGKPYLADPLFRAALGAAIDRRRLARLAGTGRAQVAHGLVSPRLLRYSWRRIRFDRSRANRLLTRLARKYSELRQAATAGRLRLDLLVDASRSDDRVIAGQLVADLDRIGIAARVVARQPAAFDRAMSSGQYQLALGRLAVQLPVGSATLAGALSAAGRKQDARACMAARRCDPSRAKRIARSMPFIPLVHPGMKVHYDARLGAVAAEAGRFPFARIYWRRR